ncbi:MAG: SDR family NAD(P)-dependent oxidoreductase [Ignavibacteria bacterium]|jgi:NADP-dependent 3-hydroxy acid dehydrogenase YdfG
MNRIQQTITLITGASSGIGEACARHFAELGSHLILMARRTDALTVLEESLSKLHPDIRILSIICDVRDRESVESAIHSLPEEWKNIDTLINNAGLSRGLEKIQDGIIENWEEMIDTNIKGLLYVSRAVLPGMVQRKKGNIVNIASIAGRETYPAGNVYCATKSAARTLSEAMRIDVNGTNIRIMNIDPGMVETEFSLVRFHGDADRAKQVYKGMQPLTSDDIAEIIVFSVNRPSHVTIGDVLILPTAQANTTTVYRES